MNAMSTLIELQQRHCTPLEGQPTMTVVEIESMLAQVPGWKLAGDAIERSYSFANYFETMAFVNALAWIAHAEDHHPDLLVGYSRCTVRFNTHSVGGISINDFICAARVDGLLR